MLADYSSDFVIVISHVNWIISPVFSDVSRITTVCSYFVPDLRYFQIPAENYHISNIAQDALTKVLIRLESLYNFNAKLASHAR